MEYNPKIPTLRPYIDPDNQGFWDGVREHRLVIQKCKDCGLVIHRPRPMCPRCLSTERDWTPSMGKGIIYAYVNVIYQNAGYPGIKAPYSVVVVEITEGVRILANLYDIEPEDVRIGTPVEICFDDIAADLTLPKFKRLQE